MVLARRVVLFLLLNFLVVLMISVVMQVLHVQPYLSHFGIDYSSLLILCFAMGMGGSLISLALSRVMAKWAMQVRIVNPETTDPEEKNLLSVVQSLAADAGLPMPKVGIYPSNEVNAFATGPSQKRSLVAVSSGLLRRMKDSDVRAILGHEMSHIANGDMITMTLLQGVVNTFVMFIARVLAIVFSGLGRGNNQRSNSSPFMFTMLVFLFDTVFMILGSMLIAAYSRFREFRADAGGARLVGRDNMVSALSALRVLHEIRDTRTESPAFNAFKISTPTKRGFLRLFATHPPLEERIERLRNS